jgi:hypothetical protein
MEETKINRRGFMATSALLLPSWWLPKIAAPPKLLDLSPFCERDDWGTRRYKMDRPFEQDDFVYATDGRVAVMARPQFCPAHTDEVGRLPPCNKLPWPDADSAGWSPLSSIVRVPDQRDFYYCSCPLCDGHGATGWTELCDCEDGWVLNYAGDDMVQCPRKCNGHGAIGGTRCQECDGKGNVDYVLKLGDGLFAPRYVHLLTQLPGAEVRLGHMANGDKKSAYFNAMEVRFEGGSAILMGLYDHK